MVRLYKKALPFIITLAMVFAVIPVIPASAANSQHVSISVSPATMSTQGTATVSITLTNPAASGAGSAAPISGDLSGRTGRTDEPGETDEPSETTPPEVTETPVTSEDPGPTPGPTNPPAPGGEYSGISISNSYGVTFETSGVTVAPGSSCTFTGTMNVTTAMIGVALSFNVSWRDSNGASYSETVTTMISRANTPYLRVTRTASPASAAPGTTVVLTYTFVNTGSVKLVNITLVDRKVANTSSPMLAPFSLDPGASTTFTYEMRMGSSTVESSPQVTYNAYGGSTQLTATVSTLVIGLINSQLTKEVIRGSATPEGVPFTIYLTNNGNQMLSGLTVKDELGNSIVSTPFSLAVGETKTIQTFIPNPSGVRYVVFKITGTDANNTTFNDNTESYAVRPYIDTSLLGLVFTAHTVLPLDKEDNRMTVEFTVENTGSLPYSNLSLTEDGLGYTLHTWEGLKSGESDTVKLDLTLDGERELVFKLKAEDSSGNPYTYEAYVTASYVDASDLVPDNAPNSSTNTVNEVGIVHDETELGAKLDKLITSTGEKLVKWFRVLGVIAVIAAIAMIVLGVSEIVIRRNNRQSAANRNKA